LKVLFGFLGETQECDKGVRCEIFLKSLKDKKTRDDCDPLMSHDILFVIIKRKERLLRQII